MNCKELNKELMTIKKNKDSLLIKKLEDLGLQYRIFDTEEYGYLRVRVVIDSDIENYSYTDIWYSKFDNGWVATDYWTMGKKKGIKL